MVCDKVVCERGCVKAGSTPATQTDGRCEFVPRLPPETKVDVRLCHAATPATQSGAASQAPNPGPRAPPSTISATPATQNDGRCDFVPRLPRETTVDVRLCHACHAKCHACHAKCHGVTGAQSRPKGATQCHLSHACHAKRRYSIDVSLCHACHVRRRWM